MQDSARGKTVLRTDEIKILTELETMTKNLIKGFMEANRSLKNPAASCRECSS
jgi:hypothetical protein